MGTKHLMFMRKLGLIMSRTFEFGSRKMKQKEKGIAARIYIYVNGTSGNVDRENYSTS